MRMKLNEPLLLLIFFIVWFSETRGLSDVNQVQRKQIHNTRTLDMFQPDFNQVQRYRDTRSVRNRRTPNIELVMHMPSEFRDINHFKHFLGIVPEKIRKKRDLNNNVSQRLKRRDSKPLVDVRSYEISQFEVNNDKRTKREVEKETDSDQRDKRAVDVPNSENIESVPLTVEGGTEPVANAKYLQASEVDGTYPEKLTEPSEAFPETIIELPEPIRGPIYTAYPENVEGEPLDPDDPRKRRNTSANDHDDGQRDKRTFMENGAENREGTTTAPYWKRKKESPPFVTGREGRVQKGSSYPPAQHRTEGARESHSMKDLDKSVQSNEIPRTGQDNYYASTNRRAYNSRQAENFNNPTPKSVYDIYDYNNPRRNLGEGRNNHGRNYDAVGKESERSRLNYGMPNDYTVNGYPRQYYGYPRVYYDRNYPYYYPYPGEVVGRGVEYYHRTVDPNSGRIIYYANMPESVRTYDGYQGRSFYSNGRTYVYDAYGRVIPLPDDYRQYTPMDVYGRPLEYRNGRTSGGEFYPNGGEKYTRDARYDSRYDSKLDRYKDKNRNKTYVIYDAEDKRVNYPRPPSVPDYNRYLYPGPGAYVPPPPIPYRQVPVPNTPYRGYYYQPPPWQVNTRSLVDGGYSPRPFITPFTTTSRSVSQLSTYDKGKKY